MLEVKVKITGSLEEFVRAQTSTEGRYDSATEYLKELLLKDMARQKDQAWVSIKNELLPGMNAPRSEFVAVSAADVIARNKR